MNKNDFEGAYIEIEHGEIRYYCRSRLDGVRTGLRIAKQDSETVAITVYDGVTDVEEMNHQDEELMLMVLQNPNVQRLMAMLGGTLIGVERLGPGDK